MSNPTPLLLRAARGESVERTPVWMMRQAGRYMKVYRDLRDRHPSFRERSENPDLSYEISMQPFRAFKPDGVILFSDILTPLPGMGINFDIVESKGPIINDPIRTDNQIKNLRPLVPQESTGFVGNVLGRLRETVGSEATVLGFVGAPWTLLVYMINRRSPKKKLIENFFKDKVLINEILFVLDKFLKIHIEQQIKNGSTVIQIFDSWAGLLNKKDLFDYVYNPTLKLVNHIKSLGIPVICFPKGIKNYNDYVNFIKPDAISIDYEVNPKYILKNIKIPVQGGLNPKFLLSSKENLKRETLKYLDLFKDHPYIFNLGHGVMPETKPDMIDYLVKLVKDY